MDEHEGAEEEHRAQRKDIAERGRDRQRANPK